ncbi:MAG TPA: hypothetical protein VF813_01415, partial [Anaerolineaceae bacterium]
MPLRFYQAELKHNDDLIFCAEPPDTWSEDNLAGGAALALDQLLRRLLIRRPDDFSCGVIQFQAGTGKITLVHVSPNPVGAVPVLVGAQPVRAVEPVPAQAAAAEVDIANPGETETGSDPDPSLSKTLQEIEPEETTERLPTAAEAPITPAVSAPTTSIPQPATPARRRSEEIKHRKPAAPEPVQSADRRKRLLPWFARLWRGGRKIQEGSSRATGGFLSSLLPGPADRPGSLSRGSMAFIAIAIPLVVVAIATTVYDQRGRTQSYQQYLTAARLAAQQAQQQTDPAVVRSYWDQVLSDLQKAGPLQIGTDTLALQQQAEIAIDQLDGITRMEYQPAVVGGLSDGVRITQMIASGTDLYLLDAGHGQVLRAILSGRGYAVDTTFSCGAGAGSGTGGVIAMVPMPRGNEYKAAVMGLDSSGGIQYCIPGEAPLAATIPQPSPKWASVTAVTYDSDSLYVLDAKSNVLWVYNGSSGTFKDPPQPFFDSETPPMGDAVDLAVNNTD